MNEGDSWFPNVHQPTFSKYQYSSNQLINNTTIATISNPQCLPWFSHLVLSHPPVRKYIIENIAGNHLERFLAEYSGIALVAFVPMTAIYLRHRTTGPALHNLANNRLFRVTSTVLRALALATASQVVSTPSPSAGADPNAKPVALSDEEMKDKIKGLVRITRHGVFTALALWGLANTISRGHAAALAFWLPYAARTFSSISTHFIHWYCH